MITGFFRSGSPYVEAHLEIPDFGVGGLVYFLLDTGADSTTLMPRDGRSLSIDYSSITDWDDRIFGVSGSIKSTSRQAVIRFTEDDGMPHYYYMDVDILPDVRRIRNVPSILGQDILYHWETIHDPSRGRLSITVRS